MNDFIKEKIRTIPNWPKAGVMFRDITTLLKDPAGFQEVMKLFFERFQNEKIDKIVGVESRGFIIGGALADRLKIGFVPVRKIGKLPAETITEDYELEYGSNKLQIHLDAINPGEKILIIDDLLATGGTALATCKLVKNLGGEIVECAFIINLPDLGGSDKLKKHDFKVFNLVEFLGE
ncbi:MAG: Adenine phosphoribosyltransferase [Candidatus Magasanikbacteria bacterium GW2011_GWC2_37_14]|uniref:Adenine phosphoribosyltransferase n=1 Tax=Candidatus Magasanikbacteria bacterium GW2011_GWC2_37_14 TaxID=1619046 RepID=A0A0G0GP20_9BACT|nr:MAG: Adenine phosphoribosyltransferase [Candidatus Magasanikbacteria bacterium GW2011_GWC2_37_14]